MEILRVLFFYPAQLDHNYNKHDEVKYKNDAEIGHHCHVEGDVIFQPAAVGESEEN